MKKLGILAALFLWLSFGLCRADIINGVYFEPDTKTEYMGLFPEENIVDSICYDVIWMDSTEIEMLRSPESYVEIEYNGKVWYAAASVTSSITYVEYIDGDRCYRKGGVYHGEMVVPERVYGLAYEELYYPVIGICDMYKNGLTSLYLPESIEWIYYTIESCRFLERVHLNNSLRELQGVRNCPVLSDCPLPLSLERIGDGWMSGIAISETEFPEPLTVIGKGVFCNNPNLAKISLGNLEETGDSCFCYLPALKEVTLPPTLRSLGAGSFSECSTLERVTLPEAPVLSEGSFNGCPMIREVSVYAQVPYDFPADCMTSTDKAACTLYVPEGCEAAYANAPGWREFGTISGTLTSGISIIDSERGEWRAFASMGRLVVDNTSAKPISVYSLVGQQMSIVTEKGRNALVLPKGLYMITCSGKTVKVSL